MRLHPVELVRDDPQVCRSRRGLDCRDSLDRFDEDHIVNHRADPADPLGEEHDFLPGTAAHDLLYALLDIAEFDLGGENPLAHRLAFYTGRLLEDRVDRTNRERNIDDLLHFFVSFFFPFPFSSKSLNTSGAMLRIVLTISDGRGGQPGIDAAIGICFDTGGFT